MSTPVVENIAANIETTIAGITVAKGFNQTLTAHRPKRIDFSDVSFEDCHVLIAMGDPTPAPAPCLCDAWEQSFKIAVVIIDSDTATASIETRTNQAVCDIIKALNADWTRGGYAKNTTIKKPTMFLDDSGAFTGAEIEISVLYYTAWNDPYTAR